MALPAVSPARIDEALDRFDREERSLPKWQNWESNRNFKHAIVKNGRLYPVKEIVAQATGIAVSEFGGGPQANGYLRNLGFQIEALRLPAKTEVAAALHDLLVMRTPSSVEPSDACQTLAAHFELPERLQAKSMDNSSENHWQNRVRQARHDLVEAGIIDRSEHGQWRLVLRPHRVVWIEKTHVQGRPDRVEGPHALGRALWSPLRAKNGADVYRNMRRVQPDDVVLHLTDDAAFTGTSIADGFARTDFVGVERTNWAGLPCYRIPLRDFVRLDPPLAREWLTTEPDIKKRLIEIRRTYSNLFYDPDLDLHQGGYLTEAPEALVTLLDSAYNGRTGHHLLAAGTRLSVAAPDLPVASPQVNLVPRENNRQEPQRVWLYAPGRRAAYWDDFREGEIAAIGWDNLGDLSGYADAEAIRARMDQVSAEPESLVNANQCLDFAHRMNPGDWIFVKKGRREIIGFEIVQSRYRFEPDRPIYRHVRDVSWQKSGSWPTASHRMLSMKTLTEITDDEALIEELEQLIGGVSDTPRPIPKGCQLIRPGIFRQRRRSRRRLSNCG